VPADPNYANSRKTHCPYGHPYDEENTYHNPNRNNRVCRTCRAARRSRELVQQRRKRSEYRAANPLPPLELKTHCPNGHEYTEENTWVCRSKKGDYRVCRTCKAEWARGGKPPRIVEPIVPCGDGSGLCTCGCGQPTKIASKTSRRNGWVKGQPLVYLPGHQAWAGEGPRWIEGPVPKERPDLGPCWIWQRSFNNQGYAVGGFTKYGYPPGTRLAGRALYELHVGPIPDGLELDHLCFTPACVRWEPAPGAPSGHLEPVTSLVNQHRARSTKLRDADLQMALLLRERGMRWRGIAEKLGVTHPPLINRLKAYCVENGIEYPASGSTRPRLT
jgi:hypothetical protein